MTPQFCMTQHNPPHSYGDCLRACVASVMDMRCEDVPHFADNDTDGDTAMREMREWMRTYEVAPFIVAYPGEITRAELMDMMQTINPDSVYILFGGVSGGGDHCVVCRGGSVVHNPAWAGSHIVGPLSGGTWQIMVVGRL